ncbi:hypothetical protein JXA80_02750 [bacterium]|nr:hypothetical protein [candidate division CSSED10-310 bacterium]
MNTLQAHLNGAQARIVLFLDPDKRLAHGFKHFLNLNEPWHTLDNIQTTRSQRKQYRKAVIETKCAGADHSRNRCREYDQCTQLLKTFTRDYSQKIREVIEETLDSGAGLITQRGEGCVLLSSEGVLVILMSLRNAKWNVATAYLPYTHQVHATADSLPFERFFAALDHVYTQFVLTNLVHHTLNDALWQNYWTATHSRSQ